MRKTIVVVLVFALFLGLTTMSAVAGGQFSLAPLVVVGDSLSAGFQNGSLLSTQQPHGYAAVLAKQAHVSLTLPLIAPPGIPNVLVLDPGPPPTIHTSPGLSTGRENPALQPTDLAVPGATVHDALVLRPECDFTGSTLVDVMTEFVLGLPGCFTGTLMSQVEWAEVMRPETAIVWLGNNDVLGAALTADAGAVTPLADFQRDYAAVVDRIAATGARLVLANLPDVTVIPFLTPAERVIEQTAAQAGLPEAVIAALLGIGSGDYVTPEAFPAIAAILANPASGPLPDNVVLTADEVTTVRAATAAFNAFIARMARETGAAFVDIHSFLNRVQAEGLEVDGRRLTTDFLGGLFSLDGIHPTNTGYAAVANQFIHAMNRRFDADIPPVSVARIAESDPLIVPSLDHPAHHHYVDHETAARVRRMFER